eukprot:gene11966-biopygen15457
MLGHGRAAMNRLAASSRWGAAGSGEMEWARGKTAADAGWTRVIHTIEETHTRRDGRGPDACSSTASKRSI